MEKQKPITLNLTKQETECIKLILEFYRKDLNVRQEEIRPCFPFLDRLQAKVSAALTKKSPSNFIHK